MNRSFYNGISGVKTHQFGMDVWANNITNINTSGFKADLPEFSTIFTQAMSGYQNGANDIGLGSRDMTAAKVMSMGSIQATDGQYDMAIGGKGFFAVSDAANETFYTRNGSFSRDASGYLVDSNGNYVLGQSANNFADGKITDDTTGDIKLSSVNNREKILLPQKLILPAKQTTYVNMKGNLDSTKTFHIDPLGNKAETATKETFRTNLFRKDGEQNRLDIIFTKVVPQNGTEVKWIADATVKDPNGNVVDSKQGEFVFDGTGAFLSTTLKSIKSDGVDVALNFGTPLGSGAYSGRDGLTSYAGDVDGKSITKDGYPQGNLDNYGVDSLGNIQAIFDNGKSLPIYKVMVFNFQNEQGLESVSSTYFKDTPNSGKAFLLKDKNGQVINQQIINRHLEMSNVDLSTAMTELIVMQKAFDASSKSITTSDQMIQNAINMKK